MNLNQNQHDILFLDIILQNVMQFNQPGLTDNQISKLPKIKITGSQIRVHKSCMVCLEDFQLNDEALMLSCFHFYHFPCISQWLKENNSCPTCRTKVEVEVDDGQETGVFLMDTNEDEDGDENDDDGDEERRTIPHNIRAAHRFTTIILEHIRAREARGTTRRVAVAANNRIRSTATIRRARNQAINEPPVIRTRRNTRQTARAAPAPAPAPVLAPDRIITRSMARRIAQQRQENE